MKRLLNDILEFKNGYTPDASEIKKIGQYPFFKIGDMNDCRNLIYLSITHLFLDKPTRIFPKGSIVYPKNGAAIATNKKRILNQESVVDLNTGVAIPKDNTNLKYIYYWFLFFDFKTITKRGAIPTLDINSLKNQYIPYPPPHIQQQIVYHLDKLNEILNKLRDTLNILNKAEEAIYYDMFGEINDYKPISYYVDSLSSGKSLASREISPNKVLKTGSVSLDEFNQNETKYLPKEYKPLLNHKVNSGDLIISRMNTIELVGACAYVWQIKDNIYLPDRLWRANLRLNANPVYLWRSIIDNKTKEQIRANASGTSGSMKNISQYNFLQIKIKKSPLSLQQTFADRITTIETQKQKISTSIAKFQEMLDGAMENYFGD